MARTKSETVEATEAKPVFDVSQTDKRNDKRVILDYVFAKRFAPEELVHFEADVEALEAVLAELAATENAEPIVTPVDTIIHQLTAKLRERYTGEYATYSLKGNGASYFLPKTGRSAKTVTQKAEDIMASATDEQLEAFAAMLAKRGIKAPEAE